MINIDGSYGSGGGQVLRTALGLAVRLNKPVTIYNIRAKRPKPGLRPQHLAVVNALAKLCNAKVEGNFISSSKVVFIPGKAMLNKLNIDIGTAGSTCLLLQALMIACKTQLQACITGGTDVSFSPTAMYVKTVTLELLKKLGFSAEVEIVKYGFMPKGQGIVNFTFNKFEAIHYNFDKQFNARKKFNASIFAVASIQLKQRKVAERLAKTTQELLECYDANINTHIHYCNTASIGCSLTLCINQDNILLGFDKICEKHKTSEAIAKQLLQDMEEQITKQPCVDIHASDQLLAHAAIVSLEKKMPIKIKTAWITEHAKTNANTIEKFMPVKFEINADKAEITIKPTLMQ